MCAAFGRHGRSPDPAPLLNKQKEKTYWPLFEDFLLLLYRVVDNHLSLAWRSMYIPLKDLCLLNHHNNLICFELWLLTYCGLFYQHFMWSHFWNISQCCFTGWEPNSSAMLLNLFKTSTNLGFCSCYKIFNFSTIGKIPWKLAISLF